MPVTMNNKTVIAAVFGLAASFPAFAFLDYPWCMDITGNGGGRFLCADKDERMKIAKESAQLSYLEYVRQTFAASTISYVAAADGSPGAVTEHRGGGGINLSADSNSSVRDRIREAAVGWFQFFCFATGGRTVRYPINDDADLIHVERLACHPKGANADELIAAAPMFGIQATRANAGGGLVKDPVIIMHHLGTGEEVKKRWGYPKVWKPGDASNLGIVTEVKVPLAKVQADGRESWVRLVELEPKR